MPTAPDSRYPDAWHTEPAADAQASGAGLDLAVRRRLLHSLASRGGVSEIPAIVIPGVLTWMHSRSGAPSGPMLAWWGAFLAFAGLLWVMQRRFLRDAALPDAVVVPRWERVFQLMAAGDGLFWAVPILLTHGAPQEFRFMVYLVICAVTASGTTFLAPLPRVFFPFFAAIYGPTLGAVVWYFPERWEVMLALVALYGGVISRHAWGSRRFVVQQVEMERQRQQLAERYRLAKEEAERALAERNRFMSTTSHDLRQPLHALGLLVEAALQRNGDAQLAPVLHDVRDCVRSLNFMFNALLDLSRLESGEFTARREDVSLAAVFEDVATVFRPDAAQRGLRLKTFLPRSQAPWVRADPALLRQMVFNLTQNALRYTQSGGLLLGVRLRGRQWRVEVWDTGAGVDPHDRDRIYSPYARGEAGRQPDVEGHGLGLAVVARCARLTGAEYGFDSTPGRGSCFWLQMPVAMPRPLPVAPPGPLALARAASLSGTCLLVDDDPQVGSALRRLLQSWGVQVQVSPSGVHAIDRLERGFVPDVILCDYRLGAGESGLALLKALQQRCGHTRCAMLTGEHAAPELMQAEEEGYLVLRKPLEPAVLHALLARWLPATGQALPSA